MPTRIAPFGAFLVVFALLPHAHAVEPPAPALRPLTPALRARLDALALAQPAVPANERLDLAGNLPAWLLSQVNLSPKEELAHASALHAQIVRRDRVVPTPPKAQRILTRLVEQLPPHLKPEPFRYTLTVLDRPGYDAFALGGGFICITRPLLTDLLAAGERGEAALAFFLADQIGHTALQHCRRGWQRLEVEEEARKGIDLHIAPGRLRSVLRTSTRVSGKLVEFLYTREQQYEADLFALHLCRNASVPTDSALDALRHLAVLRHPRLRTDPAYRPSAAKGPGAPSCYFLSAELAPLARLKALLLEASGRIDGADYGLFEYDRESKMLTRCGPGSIAGSDRPIVFIHGMRGDVASFGAFLTIFGAAPEVRGRPLLVFRYPNNASLTRAGRFLANEVKRVLTAPAKASFVCHSAGGLVFRFYTEVLHGGFDRACILGTPHQGSNLTALKFLVDVREFLGELGGGLARALDRTIPEGRGEIALDLQPDSLFLRYLDRHRSLARRYRVYYGQYLRPLQAVGLQVAFAAGKRLLEEKGLAHIQSPSLKRQAERWLEELRLPEEVLRGDLVVSVRSAALRGAGRLIKTTLDHQALKTDEALIRQVLAAIAGKDGRLRPD